jgi:hypothetical protein
MKNFVFFHIGADTEQPFMLTQSILKSNKGAKIIQCSDYSTPPVEGVSEVFRFNGNTNQIMSFRLKAFSEIRLESPAIYLDTDMLVTKQFDPRKLLQEKEVMLCRRTFNRDGIFNPNQRGLSFYEYSNSKLDSIYPFLACATITRNWNFWHELLELLKQKDKKFLEWYGDQEAMREWHISNKDKKVGYLSESVFGCLPEFSELIKNAKVLHFKGPNRKELMPKFFTELDSPRTRNANS